MEIAVVGTGYVGLVVGACLAEMGNDVMCADVDAGKTIRTNRQPHSVHGHRECGDHEVCGERA